MNDKPTIYTADDLALELGCKSRKIRDEARKIGVGMNLGGRAGYRFTEADRARIHEAMRPSAPVAPRRRRRAA